MAEGFWLHLQRAQKERERRGCGAVVGWGLMERSWRGRPGPGAFVKWVRSRWALHVMCLAGSLAPRQLSAPAASHRIILCWPEGGRKASLGDSHDDGILILSWGE